LVPVFGDEKYKIDKKSDKKININYFNLIQMIGEGGFSKVILG
jgi:hypothetical protein